MKKYLFCKFLKNTIGAVVLSTSIFCSNPTFANDPEVAFTDDVLKSIILSLFEAEQMLEDGNRKAAISALQHALPPFDLADDDLPKQAKEALSVLRRALFTSSVSLEERYEFDYGWLSPKGTRVLTQKQLPEGQNEVVIWDTDTGRRVSTFVGSIFVSPSQIPGFSSGDELIAWMETHQDLVVVNALDGSIAHRIRLYEHEFISPFWYGRVMFSPDGSKIVVPRDYINPFVVLDAASGEILLSLEENGPQPAVSFEPDVTPYKERGIPYRNNISARFWGNDALCVFVSEPTRTEPDQGKGPPESLYAGKMDLEGRSLNFDTVLNHQVLADEAFSCHPGGGRAVKGYQAWQFTGESGVQTSSSFYIGPNGTIDMSFEHSRSLSGFVFSEDGASVLLQSNRPAIFDTYAQRVITDLLEEVPDFNRNTYPVVFGPNGDRIRSLVPTKLDQSVFSLPLSYKATLEKGQAFLDGETK
ncbi:MAG: hypothetical protein MK130_06375 [Puniceicoccaceae bacterium]|nr:hypothetical protein [Puniceicoccaceae bacterium]